MDYNLWLYDHSNIVVHDADFVKGSHLDLSLLTLQLSQQAIALPELVLFFSMITDCLLITNSIVWCKFDIAFSQEGIMFLDYRVESCLELVNIDGFFVFEHLGQSTVADVDCPWFAPIANSVSPDEM